MSQQARTMKNPLSTLVVRQWTSATSAPVVTAHPVAMSNSKLTCSCGGQAGETGDGGWGGWDRGALTPPSRLWQRLHSAPTH